MDPTSPIRGIMAGAPLPAGGLMLGAIVMETINCHGYPVLGIELQSKSLGNHHHWCIHDCSYRYRRTRFVLCVFCNSGSCVHFVDYLVYLEVETSS